MNFNNDHNLFQKWQTGLQRKQFEAFQAAIHAKITILTLTTPSYEGDSTATQPISLGSTPVPTRKIRDTEKIFKHIYGIGRKKLDQLISKLVACVKNKYPTCRYNR